MLTNWLTFTAFLAASAKTERAANGHGTLTIAPTHRVTGHPEVQLTLNCGDGRNAGALQHWHTPFGELRPPGSHGKPAPVILQRDGSLTIPHISSLHRGVYYCLLRDAKGTTLWPYDLHVDGRFERGEAFRFRREAGVSHGHFAGAVAASVLVTFVVGFSAGALTRTPVLRCLRAVTTRLKSPRQHHRRTNTPVGGSEVTKTTKPPIFNNQAIKMVQGSDDDFADCAMAKAPSSTPAPPHAEPQPSFRHKQNTTACVEGWDQNNECDGEARGERDFGGYHLEDGGSQSETENDKCSKHLGEKDEVRSQEEAGNKDKGTNVDGGQRRGIAEEKGRDQEEVNDRAKRREKDGETDICSEDSETGSSKQEGGGARSPSSPPARRRRVIRLYQYDEEGRRYGHLPDATVAPEPSPDQRLKQRSLSLTRLNAIMAAATAGPLDTREAGTGEERPHFHMEI